MMKKVLIGFSILAIIGLIAFALTLPLLLKTEDISDITIKPKALMELPKPQISKGARGELGIDKNVNESTIDLYLNREDSVYRDMRMLEDPSEYENIGGDKFLSGYIDGFEVIPLPYIIPVTGLPEEVGDTYSGTTLFREENGTYIANYEESMSIINELFPKDKVIFLMCGGGGYAGMTKNFLVTMGWDENKIYNTGGYWYYRGENSIEVKKEVDGEVTYDFDIVPYHDVKFDTLTKSEKYKDPDVKVTEVKLNTDELEVDEGFSFQLSVIVLPNEATNKDVTWSSSDESIATVSEDGLVEGVSVGNATITVKSVDGNKKATCDVTVNEYIATRVKLDDVDYAIAKYEAYDISIKRHEYYQDFKDTVNSDLEKYYDRVENGRGIGLTDAYREESKKYNQRVLEEERKKAKILDNLIDEEKSFIVTNYTKDCEGRDYEIVDNARRILAENGYSFFETADEPSATKGDGSFRESKISKMMNQYGGAVIIIKNGKIVGDTTDVAIRNDEELINWLNQYVKIEE